MAIASKLSLNIIRDGTQSMEGNRLRQSDMIDIAQKIDAYMQLLPQNALAVCESWGGASVIEPVRLNGADSFENLEHILKIAPNTPHSCLYRGTQGFGYLPLCAEDQETILQGVCDIGIRYFRIFDMMNDVDNLKASVHYLHQIKNTHNPIIELAICTNSERDQTPKLRTKAYYTQILQQYMTLKPDRLAIKDYSGLCDYDEIKQVIDIIQEFDSEIPIAVHAHTEKSETLAKLLHHGAATVDVGLSAWAGGNAHSDYFLTLYAYLQQAGIDTKDPENTEIIEKHPLILKARALEGFCDLIAPPYRAIRVPKHKQPKKEALYQAKIASGGLVAMRDMLVKNLNSAHQYLESQNRPIPLEQALMDASLYKMAELWDAAGRPDTVTPGSLILSKAANILTFQQEIYQKTITLKDIPQEYKNLVMGRYGKNWGFQNGFGCHKMRQLFLLEAGLLHIKTEYPHIYQQLIEKYPEIEIYTLQQDHYSELLDKAFDYTQFITELPDKLQIYFKPNRFKTPESVLQKAQKNAQQLIDSGMCRHAYGRHIDMAYLQKRLTFLCMSVKYDIVKDMIAFKADGMTRGQIEKDPRALFWRDTICAGNVKQAYADLVELMKLYPPGKLTRTNQALRARKRRTLSLTMTEIGIENDFVARGDIHNIYFAHRKVAQAIIKAKKDLSDALDYCMADHQAHQFYKSQIIGTVLKQATLDAINHFEKIN